MLSNYTWMERFFEEVTRIAKMSPCERRQYGAGVIENQSYMNTVECNSRVTDVCNEFCIRTQQGIKNGHHTQTELGAEIHAEAATLISIKRPIELPNFILVGFIGEHELLGEDAYPCLWCAKMIKFAGFKNIFLRDKSREIRPYSIAEIIEYWEEPYESV